MYPCYQLYKTLFSWEIFRIFPSKYKLIEQPNHFRGFAIDWLGFEFCFEELKEVGCQLKSKRDII